MTIYKLRLGLIFLFSNLFYSCTAVPYKAIEINNSYKAFEIVNFSTINNETTNSKDSKDSKDSNDSNDKWDNTEIILGTLFTISTIVDWGQTRDLVKHPESGHYELNPILGEYPSENNVNLYFPIAIASILSISDILPPYWKKTFLTSALSLQLNVINNNHKLGWRMNF